MEVKKQWNRTRGRPKMMLNKEERARREIANYKEKRRMMEINKGIENLRKILYNNENIFFKISKVEVLRGSVRLIQEIEARIEYLEQENVSLKISLNNK